MLQNEVNDFLNDSYKKACLLWRVFFIFGIISHSIFRTNLMTKGESNKERKIRFNYYGFKEDNNMANIIVQVLENMNTKEFMKQKEWLAEQVAALEPSGSEATRFPEGILNFMDAIQDAAEFELDLKFPSDLESYLMKQGIWERETAEILENFNDDVTEDDLIVSAIYDSVYELGERHINNVVGTLDPYVNAVLDYSTLGKYIAENEDDLYLLESGRVVRFEM